VSGTDSAPPGALPLALSLYDTTLKAFTNMQLTTKYYLPVPLFAFVAWILLLLATVSAPINKSFYIAQVTADIDVGGRFNVAKASTSVRFGVAGWCISELKASVLVQSTARTSLSRRYFRS